MRFEQELHINSQVEYQLEYETLNGEEVQALMRNEPIRQGGSDMGPTKPRSTIPTSGGTIVQRPGGFEPKPQPGA